MLTDKGALLPDLFLREIGRVTVEWNVLESMLDFCLVKLAGHDLSEPRAFIPFAHMAFPQKVDSLSALVKEVVIMFPGESRLNEGLAIARPKLKLAQDGRNWVMHSKWGAEENGTVTVASLKARGELKTLVTVVGIDAVEKVSQDINEALKALYTLLIGRPI